MAEEFRVLRPREYHTQLISKKRRADGRELEEVRELKLETDAIRTADSSSLVKLGNTSLVCGCTTKIMNLKDRNEENDEIRIKVELPPICTNLTGYKSQNAAQLLSRTLKNILDDAKCLDKQNFHIDDSDLYWSVDVEVICLNYDGCLLDASLVAILSALKSLKLNTDLPNIEARSVELNTMPVCSSFAMIGDTIICDPNLEEEMVAQTLFSITIDPKTSRICHIKKVGGKSLSNEDLCKCINIVKKRVAGFEQTMDCT